MADDNNHKDKMIQKPGTDIRPKISSTNEATELAKKIFGIVTDSVTQLNGYDDKNYHLTVSSSTNPHLTSIWPHGYVLKVMNSLDSKDVDFVEAQNELMLFVSKHGVCTPNPVMNLHGKYYSLEPLPTSNSVNGDGQLVSYHIVRLLKYQPGILLKEVACSLSPLSSPSVYYNIGYNAGVLNNIMKNFEHNAYTKRKSIWHLSNVLEIKQFLYVIEEKQKLSEILRILEDFEKTVLKNLDNLKKGLIHGDLNESNILVKYDENNTQNSNKSYKVCAILDYGDTHVSGYIIELAIIICYMLIQTKILDTGRYIVNGYNKANPLPAEEYKLIPVCVKARLCQSLVMGIYNYSLDTSNKYVMETQETGWQMLEILTSTDKNQLIDMWTSDIFA